MPVSPLSQSADPADAAKPPAPESTPASAFSDRPLCVHHQGEITVIVYSSPSQEPKRLNHPILPSLHIMLVEEGKEIEGLAAILADYLNNVPPVSEGIAEYSDALATVSGESAA